MKTGQILTYHHRKEMDFMVEHTMTKETLKNQTDCPLRQRDLCLL